MFHWAVLVAGWHVSLGCAGSWLACFTGLCLWLAGMAMIQRGLVVHDSGDFLTCLHHNKQLHGFDACVSHFTVVKNFHQNEAPSLDDLAENIQINVQNEQAGWHGERPRIPYARNGA